MKEKKGDGARKERTEQKGRTESHVREQRSTASLSEQPRFCSRARLVAFVGVEKKRRRGEELPARGSTKNRFSLPLPPPESRKHRLQSSKESMFSSLSLSSAAAEPCCLLQSTRVTYRDDLGLAVRDGVAHGCVEQGRKKRKKRRLALCRKKERVREREGKRKKKKKRSDPLALTTNERGSSTAPRAFLPAEEANRERKNKRKTQQRKLRPLLSLPVI